MSPLFQSLLLLGVLLLVGLCAALTRIFSGMKNAVFYAKGQAYRVERLQPYLDNLHRIEAPNWYTSFLPTFLLLVVIGVQRGLPWYLAPLAAYLLAQGASTAASYWYQGWINLGCMLPWVDPNENPKAEFAITWPVTFSFWWPRWWHGTRRRFLPVLGAVMILAGSVLLVWY